jgi:hypothetical protein
MPAREIALGTVQLAAGQHVLGPAAIDDDVNGLEIGLRRLAWPRDADTPVVVLEAQVEIGGVWRSLFALDFVGGVDLDRNGLEISIARARRRIPAGTGRRARVRITVLEVLQTEVLIRLRTDLPPVQPRETPHSVTYDTVDDVSTASSGTTLTLSALNPVGTTDLCAVAFAGNYRGAGASAPSGITHDGVAMTAGANNTSGAHSMAGYRRAGIDADAADVVATWATAQSERWLGCAILAGVDQTNPVDDVDSAGGSGTSASLTLTGSTDGLGVDGCWSEGSGHTPDSGQTERIEETGIGGFETASISTEPASASFAMGQTWTTNPSTARPYRYVAFSLKAASGGAPTQISGVYSLALTMTGVVVRKIPLTASMTLALTMTGVVVRKIPLTASMALALSMTGAFGKQLQGAMTLALTMSGVVVRKIPLTASMTLALSMTGAFGKQLQGAMTLALTMSGGVVRKIPLTASMALAFSLTGQARRIVRLVAPMTLVLIASGGLSISGAFLDVEGSPIYIPQSGPKRIRIPASGPKRLVV